ncbi:MAG: alpha/beta fold hydrolase [Myxococcota bacterium]
MRTSLRSPKAFVRPGVVSAEEPVTGIDRSVPLRVRVGGGFEVAYLDQPSADPETDEPPLVLIHGFTGHRDDFIGVVPALARSRRVLVPDLRGHGDSSETSGPLGWSFDQLVKDVGGWLEVIGIERCDLLGHSLGGMVALRCALQFPERLRSLILMCTAPEAPKSLSREALIKAADLAEALGMPRLQELTEKAGRVSPSETIRGWGERYWAHNLRRLTAMTPQSYRGIGTELFDAPSQVSRLADVDMPTLVLVGEHDGDFLPGADLFEKHLPNVQRRTLPNAEHHPHQENQDEFLAEMEAHFSRLAEGPV